ncbi:MAG: hypothetical protein HGB23_06020 [Chlorobiaceae bacterium]|nr:hypothetical protein [Chlorobiaceae bacterium]
MTNGVGGVLTDMGTKIFKIDVKIFNPDDAGKSNSSLSIKLQTSFGFCFAGSYLNGSLFADTIEEILSNIQAIPYSDISIENLSDIAFAVYKNISSELSKISAEQGLSEVLFAGYCPVTGDLKAYRFSVEVSTEIIYSKFVVAENDFPLLLGSVIAKQNAIKLLCNMSDKYTIFHIIRELIKDENIETVGGGIQVGVFSLGEFNVNGLMTYEILEDEFGVNALKENYTFRGIDLDFNNLEINSGFLNNTKMFLDPFYLERTEYFDQIHNELDEKNTKAGLEP